VQASSLHHKHNRAREGFPARMRNNKPRVAPVRSVLIIAVVLGGCALAGIFNPARSQPERLPDLPAVAQPADPHTLYGVGHPGKDLLHRPATSCAAASCHGGGQIGKLGSEHSTWARELNPTGATGDPHSKAYSVLFNADSVQMGKLLKLKNAPHQEALCLKCHAVESAGVPAATRDQMLSEGVGCGACHGPADKWINIHYLPEWKTYSNQKKWQEFGFVPANNLVARTMNCASCHVGDADREVNHDLIAAGHPRLAFEAARFHYQPDYRKHWVEKTPLPDFEVRLWIIGQAATLRAAADLLRVRAERASSTDGDTPWPEFAGYSCYACHQKVGDAALRGTTAARPRPAGAAGWEVWSTTAAGIAAETCGAAYPGLSSPELREVEALRKMMDVPRPPAPGRVKLQAAKAVAELDAWLTALQAAEDAGVKPLPAGTADRLAHRLAANALAKDKPLLADHDWDALAANYLGSAAMLHASGGPLTSPWGREVLALDKQLRFPPVPGRGRFNSPADLTHEKLDRIRLNFIDLRKATGPTGGK
jgi:Cytochrome c554 and c-prime